MKTKIAVAALLTITAGMFTFTRTKNAPPSDFRDAPNSSSALEQAGYDKSNNIAIPVPEPSLDKSTVGGNAVSKFLVVGIYLNLQAFKGDTGDATKQNVKNFVAQLGKTMVDYYDTSAIKMVTVVSKGDRGVFATIGNQVRIESELKDLPDIKRFKYAPLATEQNWLIEFKQDIYRDKIERLFAPIIKKHDVQIKYHNSIEVFDRGDLSVQILADFKGPAAYTRQLQARFPDKIKYAHLYLRTQEPDGSSSSSLYRGGDTY